MDFDYKKYSLERLEEWVHDAISSAEASPQEIYDVIKGVVEEQYYYFKQHTGRCYELLCLLNGNGKGHIQAYDEYVQMKKEDKVIKWQLPVQVDGLTGDCFVEFPDDLLEAANLKEGDQVEWVDRGDGSYLLKKVNKDPSWVEGNELGKIKTYDEMIAEGWTMTADGFWIRESNQSENYEEK
jgi:bifunctional DNA-binding transcriptional regulator/antitoxin component of YhaV-PrlF toxin-antitoxin module